MVYLWVSQPLANASDDSALGALHGGHAATDHMVWPLRNAFITAILAAF